jgi:hypothetical protein
MAFDKFLEKFPPTQAAPPGSDLIEKYSKVLPAQLIELWQTQGIGKYADGYLELVNPDLFNDTLATWLAKRVPTYVPIVISAFGDLFYYRKLTETDEDVCVLDPHYRSINNCTWSINSFFNDYLTADSFYDTFLRRELFLSAQQIKGPLALNEIYFFVPALALGGAEEAKYIDKGNAQVQMDILFQLG